MKPYHITKIKNNMTIAFPIFKTDRLLLRKFVKSENTNCKTENGKFIRLAIYAKLNDN